MRTCFLWRYREYGQSLVFVFETCVQEMDKRNPGAISEIREMKCLKEAAQ